jgi:epoxide hydrolase 4
VSVDGREVHIAEAGYGPPVLLLHGFPEFWYSWREQLPALAGAGFHAIAPDLRGYNLTHRPTGLQPYRAVSIAGEVVSLIDAVAGGKAHLVGHDWGGLLAWLIAIRAPGAVDRLAVLNTPHPGALRRMKRRPQQLLRFSYQIFFQLPLLPELALRTFRFAGLKMAMRKMLQNRGSFPPEVVARYEEAWGRPGAVTAMLNYYRALHRLPREFPRGPAAVVHQPTLLIWGDRDPVFKRNLFEATAEFVEKLTLERIPGGGHFIHQDDPAAVNALLIDFLTGGRRSSSPR